MWKGKVEVGSRGRGWGWKSRSRLRLEVEVEVEVGSWGRGRGWKLRSRLEVEVKVGSQSRGWKSRSRYEVEVEDGSLGWDRKSTCTCEFHHELKHYKSCIRACCLHHCCFSLERIFLHYEPRSALFNNKKAGKKCTPLLSRRARVLAKATSTS